MISLTLEALVVPSEGRLVNTTLAKHTSAIMPNAAFQHGDRVVVERTAFVPRLTSRSPTFCGGGYSQKTCGSIAQASLRYLRSAAVPQRDCPQRPYSRQLG